MDTALYTDTSGFGQLLDTLGHDHIGPGECAVGYNNLSQRYPDADLWTYLVCVGLVVLCVAMLKG